MKQIIVSIILSIAVIGCTWEDVENNAEKVNAGATTTGKIATVVSPLAGPYGELVTVAAGAVGAISLAVAKLAKAKQQKIAKAAVIAAENTSGGGSAIVESAGKLGVAELVSVAYEDALKAGLIKPK